MITDFDSYQQAIINLKEGTHLVLAPPGCGKTAILAERVRNAITNGIDPEKMLCLTFTNRASRSMSERIGTLNNNLTAKVFTGNTHRFCAHYLFENNVVEKSTGIMDENDCISILCELDKQVEANLQFDSRKKIIKAYNLQHVLHQFENKHPNSIIFNPGKNIMKELGELCEEMGLKASKSAVCELYNNPNEMMDNVGKVPYFAPIIAILKLAAAYRDYKREHGLIDFDDLLLLAYDDLRYNKTRKRYSWIQVDEVQDLNPLQIALIDELVEKGNTTSVIFLGDEQQSIFSFIGAKMSTLTYLKEKCGGNIHHLANNYRSPRYLLEMSNLYASKNFGIPDNLLPRPLNNDSALERDMCMIHADDNIKAIDLAAELALNYSPDETTAVIVPTNRDADLVSDALGTIPHFKISGTDFFAGDAMQTILSHLSVLANEHNNLAWTKLLTGLKLIRNSAAARATIMKMAANAVLASDFLLFENGSYLTRFIENYQNGPIVIFDTETTGLDVLNDDIVQIAAIKIENNAITDKLNILLHTDKKIPEMLGDIENPLIKVYAAQKHFTRKEGLELFLKFSQGAALAGHNVEFDLNIFDANLKRDAQIQNFKQNHINYFDTLKLARLLLPRQFSYKLKDLLEAFQLQGENSHLADDDIIATKSLADFLYIKGSEIIPAHLKLLDDASRFREKFRNLYGNLYINATATLYEHNECFPINLEIKRMHEFLLESNLLAKPLDKLNYALNLIEKQSHNIPHNCLKNHLDSILVELNTFREADFCESGIVKENIFVTTVHKAKGLEFENVIIYGVVDGTYPFFASKTEDEQNEDARKLYVALTRSKRRLVLLNYNLLKSQTTYGTRVFERNLSPFLRPVAHLFAN